MLAAHCRRYCACEDAYLKKAIDKLVHAKGVDSI